MTAPESWWLLRSGLSPAPENMALDEVLLQNAAGLARPVLRFYGWTAPAASFGYFQRYVEVERLTALRPLIRRPTGGGIVPHAADWTYSLVVPPAHPWYLLRAVESYQRVHAWMQTAFARLGLPTDLAPEPRREGPGQCFVGAEQFDLIHDAHKIAGAAQRRNRHGLLIQGSVQPPAAVSCKRVDWEQAVCAVASEAYLVRWEVLQLPPEIRLEAEELTRGKYAQPAHNTCR